MSEVPEMPKDMVSIPAGEFLMGSNDFYPEERAVHRVSVDAFWIDERGHRRRVPPLREGHWLRNGG